MYCTNCPKDVAQGHLFNANWTEQFPANNSQKSICSKPFITSLPSAWVAAMRCMQQPYFKTKFHWNILEGLLKLLLKFSWNTPDTSYKHPFNLIRMSLDTLWTSFRYPWSSLESHSKVSRNASQSSLKHSLNFLEISLKHLWNFLQTPIELLVTNLETFLKHHRKFLEAP